jgi:4-hydroxyphenylpyruvate dioxygenase-like putative hemolysin
VVARDIGYVELYTRGRQCAVDYFVLSLGFEQVAESADHGRNSVLPRQGSMQLLVTTGPAAGAFSGPEPAIRRQLMLDAVTVSFDDAPGRHRAACDREPRRVTAARGAA